MNPAFSVIFLTTLIGAAQGLFLALFGAQLAGLASPFFLATGGAVALALTVAGLVASFFHLGRPERAWRTATMWRTSWLSREVIALPLFMGSLFLWTIAQAMGLGQTLALGVLTALACGVLFVCTAMIYASIKFLQEWASAYTLVNYTLLGLASGCTLATALAGQLAPELVGGFGVAALLFTAVGLVSRGLSLARNERLVPRSTLQTAIGIRHPQITQRAQGFMGGSFNTREFFHGKTPGALRNVKWAFLLGAFVLPLALVALGLVSASAGLLVLAFAVQYLGLLAERWFFFAQANHPQNLYYQTVA
ncbi:DmsC/YnfH family molybdoenzyme membrane anchor subunit [Hydrogenophaga sp.]|uniref:dimethyl sulfoxide reductase anchor subunit family protein n=1 Tax=Hydrogenophaga sp. TaxID=1904254 RepID=UPI00271A3F3D|nr:DmsC/YnfH family molybdoenzyme membrane anchor subunit [Hydrogenophaga sp.]MDO8904989.1 DmsC/YnfH family molybdoenzyme membrane anchor subunit [Hydrogenophaga sp.]